MCGRGSGSDPDRVQRAAQFIDGRGRNPAVADQRLALHAIADLLASGLWVPPEPPPAGRDGEPSDPAESWVAHAHRVLRTTTDCSAGAVTRALRSLPATVLIGTTAARTATTLDGSVTLPVGLVLALLVEAGPRRAARWVHNDEQGLWVWIGAVRESGSRVLVVLEPLATPYGGSAVGPCARLSETLAPSML